MDGVRPQPIRVSKRGIWAYAERAAVALRFAPGDSIEPLVARLGGRILYKNASPGEAKPESIVVRSSGDFTIFLPSMTSSARNRFSIAHELGHLFLHFPRVAREHPGEPMIATRWVDEDDPEQQRAEWEANWFGSAFLMPRDAFRDAYKSDPIDEVADSFGVSVQAAQVRAQSLRL